RVDRLRPRGTRSEHPVRCVADRERVPAASGRRSAASTNRRAPSQYPANKAFAGNPSEGWHRGAVDRGSDRGYRGTMVGAAVPVPEAAAPSLAVAGTQIVPAGAWPASAASYRRSGLVQKNLPTSKHYID